MAVAGAEDREKAQCREDGEEYDEEPMREKDHAERDCPTGNISDVSKAQKRDGSSVVLE